MNKKHLLWIIPISFFIGGLVFMGFYAHIEMVNNRYMFDMAMCCYSKLYNMTDTIFCY